MKKKLEADLMSIAHRILQMKSKSDVNQLYVETQKLYEKLAVLQFVETHFSEAKPTIGQAEIIEKLGESLPETLVTNTQAEITQEEKIILNEISEEIVIEEIVLEEVAAEEIIPEEIIPEEIVAQEIEQEIIATEPIVEVKKIVTPPAFELEKEKTEATPKKEMPQISFDEMLGASFDDNFFVKVEDNKAKANPLDFELPKITKTITEKTEVFVTKTEVVSKSVESKVATLNEKLSKGIQIDLNDRIAFVKHLFANSNEDYMRVYNQLITFDNIEETHDFIENMVKPDYDNWEGKEEYAQRFIQIIEKKFV